MALVSLFLIIAVLCFADNDELFPGKWQGRVFICNSFWPDDSLLISIDIKDAHNISGNIGDAVIDSGLIRMNGIIARLFGNPDYRIYLFLNGNINDSLEINRTYMSLLADFGPNTIAGGCHSSGRKFGGAKDMIITGYDMLLWRVKEE